MHMKYLQKKAWRKTYSLFGFREKKIKWRENHGVEFRALGLSRSRSDCREKKKNILKRFFNFFNFKQCVVQSETARRRLASCFYMVLLLCWEGWMIGDEAKLRPGQWQHSEMAVRRASWWGWRLREPRQSLICIYCLRHWAFCGLELGSSLSGLIIPWASVQPNKPFLLCLEIGILYSISEWDFLVFGYPLWTIFVQFKPSIHPTHPKLWP